MRADSGSHIGLSDKRVAGQALFDGRLFLRVARGSFQGRRRAGSPFVTLLHYDDIPKVSLRSQNQVNATQTAREASSLTSWTTSPQAGLKPPAEQLDTEHTNARSQKRSCGLQV
jgi:hypothetical protein